MNEFESEPLELFLYAIRSDATKDRYQKRLGNFFDHFGYSGSLAEQAKQFITDYKQNGIN